MERRLIVKVEPAFGDEGAFDVLIGTEHGGGSTLSTLPVPLDSREAAEALAYVLKDYLQPHHERAEERREQRRRPR